MSIEVKCSCGRQLRARDEQAGKRCKCPGCGTLLTVPEAFDVELIDEMPERATEQGTADVPMARRADVPDSPTSVPMARVAPQIIPTVPGIRRTYWLLLLLVAPLAYSTIAGPAVTFEQQVEATIKAHPEVEDKIHAVEEGEGELEEHFDALPGHRFAGALHARGSWAHWIYALVAGAMFIGIILIASPGQEREGEVNPLHLLYAGLFTGTAGVVLLISIQIFGLFTCFIGALYLAAEHPDAPFGPSLLGFVLGVGFFEEAIKAIPVLWRLYRPQSISWRGACLWGMASGAGFGVSEGVHYSSSYYNGVSTAEDYLLRFTSIAALHVLLSGACGILLHRHRRHLDAEEDWGSWLLTMAAIITVPMLLHGLYNTLLKKEFEVPALAIWLLCFAWLAHLIESSYRRDKAALNTIPTRARFIQTPHGLRMLQD
jgi:RsiW-degrading membrane proteinase PrsW (M82 family)